MTDKSLVMTLSLHWLVLNLVSIVSLSLQWSGTMRQSCDAMRHFCPISCEAREQHLQTVEHL
ncbi:hypothetical protein M758_7G122200 [Ceratodon purpureus]|uniref:Uncharacterized protein n=1 Tax=Ceratodon purpureus TaxID=3225 RepID=A0A8T0HA33_CERPU|nr:hypothetical protein KC19_7G155200 [Ceratodon purpureus]KAG0611187.1 hypothetical protein M758_7G122200 [Ceratodon purpureus]